MFVHVAEKHSLFAGNVDAVFISVKVVCMKIFGGCLAMESFGSALIAVNGMGLVISDLTWQ
jgi:hypothetical protein